MKRTIGRPIGGDGHAALVALVREAQGLVGDRGLPVRLVLLRLRKGRRPEDAAARAHLYGTEPGEP